MKELRESILDDDFVDKVKLADIYDFLRKGDVTMELKTDLKYMFANHELLKPRSSERKQLKETLRYAIGPCVSSGTGVEVLSVDQDILIDAFIKWIEPFLNTTGKYIVNKYKNDFQVRVGRYGKNSDPGKYRIGNNAGMSYSLEFKDGPSYLWKKTWTGPAESMREFPCVIRVDVVMWNKSKR